MRASDIGIVSPVNGSVVTSGAAGQTIARIKDAGITFFQEGAKGVYRDTEPQRAVQRVRRPEEIGDEIDQDERRPDDYLPWGEAADLPKGQKATSIAASFSGGHVTNWQFKGGTYDNLNSYAADGDEFTADTVLVLRVPGRRRRLHSTPPATRCPRPSSRARATRWSSTTAGWCAAPGPRTASTASSTLSTKAGKI